MRKIAALTLGFVLVASTLALAIEPLVSGECTYIEDVEITYIDYDAQWIIVFDPDPEGEWTVQVTDRTVITARGREVPFEYLEEGMWLKRVCGRLRADDVLYARRIVVQPSGG